MGSRANKLSSVAVRGRMYAVRQTQNFNASFPSENLWSQECPHRPRLSAKDAMELPSGRPPYEVSLPF